MQHRLRKVIILFDSLSQITETPLGISKTTQTAKIKVTSCQSVGIKSHVSDYFSFSAYGSEWWHLSLLLIPYFTVLLSPIDLWIGEVGGFWGASPHP